MHEDLCFLGLARAADLIRRRELSPVALTEAFLARVETFNPQLHAYLTLTADHARRLAAEAETEIARGRHRGPLHGIPFALKDNFDTAGIRTTAQSRLLEYNVPARDATVVRKLYDAGAVLLGKATTHEFAHGGPSFDLPWPPARNPWNTLHFTGGSSSGSAAAVAAGLTMCALGSDTGGSVRSPSWFCGTVGLKPTFGLIGRTGLVPFSSSCDHVGPMTRSVEDCALLLEAIAGHDPEDSGSASLTLPPIREAFTEDLRGLKLGVIRHFWEEDLDIGPELARAVDGAIEVLRSLGATVETVRLRSLHEYYAVRLMLTESELYALHQPQLRERVQDYGHHFLSRCLPACLYTAADYIWAQRQRARIIDEMKPVYANYDGFITAGAGPAPSLQAHKQIGGADKFLRPGMGTLFSVTGAPALALPCGFSASGLPLGFQIAGRPFEDATVLRIGHAYEQATRWCERRPQLRPGDTAPPIDPGSDEDIHVTLDGATRAMVETMAHRAGLKLPPTQLALLLETAPYALELVKRIRRDLPWTAGQAATFRME
jgi:aspartyl-tRNA(Asn)/glutamyl-tRNA(Gln) amidotransferase subunit A